MRFGPADIYKKESAPRFSRRGRKERLGLFRSGDETEPTADAPLQPGPPGSAAGRPLRRRRSSRVPPGRKVTILVTVLLSTVMILYIALVGYTWAQKKRGKYSQPPPVPVETDPGPLTPPPHQGGNEGETVHALLGPSIAPTLTGRLEAWKSATTTLRRILDTAFVRSPELAVVELEKQLQATPSMLNVRMELARRYVQQGQGVQAVKMLMSVLEQNSAEREARILLARTLLSGKDYEAAILTARWILGEEAYSTECHNILATCFLATDRVGEALPHLRKLVDADRLNIAAQNNLGTAYMRLGEHARGAEIFSKVIQISPENSAAHFHLSVCHARQDRVADACATLRAAAQRFGSGFVATWIKDKEFDSVRGMIPFQRLSSDLNQGILDGTVNGIPIPGQAEEPLPDDSILPLPPVPKGP